MIIAREDEIPHAPLRPIFSLWRTKCRNGHWPTRAEIGLDELRSAAAHALFCKIEPPYTGLSSIRFVNTGSGFIDATATDVTGMTVQEVLEALGSTPEFTHCFGEYALAAEKGVSTYNEGRFPWKDQEWLQYRRLVMPLGHGEHPCGLFVMCDFLNGAVKMRLPHWLKGGTNRPIEETG